MRASYYAVGIRVNCRGRCSVTRNATIAPSRTRAEAHDYIPGRGLGETHMNLIARLFAFIGHVFIGVADIFARRAREDRQAVRPRFDPLEGLPEELDDDFTETPDAEERLYLDFPDSFQIGQDGETIFKGNPPVLFNETGRTIARTNCRITAFFGLIVRDNRAQDHGRFRFAELQPEITLTTNGSLAVRIGVTAVGDFPGTLTIAVTRDAPGSSNPAAISFRATDMPGVEAELRRRPEIPVSSPPNMDARNRVVTETLTASVTWAPDGANPCSITPPEKLRVTWNFANPRAAFNFSRPGSLVDPRRRSSVSHGESLVEETFPDGRVHRTVAVQSFFVVADPNVCCGAAGEYAVIQFVRHRYTLREAPPKSDHDTWTLDILDTEGQRARNGNSYDPTFTHNPRGTNAGAPPLVYPGPNGAGSSAINQVDRPGISRALYDRFAAAGGEFVFHFLSLLVCKTTPSEAATYLAGGKVSQVMIYEIVLSFAGGGRAPTISGRMLEVEVYTACRNLRQFIDAYDRRNGSGPTGRLADGYRAPRGHEVGIPR